MDLEKTLDKWLESRKQSLDDFPTLAHKILEMKRQWGMFARWMVQDSGKYYDIVITVQNGTVEDVEGLPEGWEWTLNDLDEPKQ